MKELTENDDNYISNEASQAELDIIKEYTEKGKLVGEWLPFMTYDMRQMGYPRPNHGGMCAMAYGGTNAKGELIAPDGMWCKVEDVKKYLDVNGTKSKKQLITKEKIKEIMWDASHKSVSDAGFEITYEFDKIAQAIVDFLESNA